MAAAPSRIGHAHPAALWLTPSYLRACRAERSRAGQAFPRSQTFPRSKAGERSGVGPQRHLGGDGLFDMSASQAFKAGVAFHHVHAALRARRSDFKTAQCVLPCQAGTWLAPPSSVVNRLEVADNDCHQGARRGGSLRYPLLLSAAGSRRESRVK